MATQRSSSESGLWIRPLLTIQANIFRQLHGSIFQCNNIKNNYVNLSVYCHIKSTIIAWNHYQFYRIFYFFLFYFFQVDLTCVDFVCCLYVKATLVTGKYIPTYSSSHESGLLTGGTSEWLNSGCCSLPFSLTPEWTLEIYPHSARHTYVAFTRKTGVATMTVPFSYLRSLLWFYSRPHDVTPTLSVTDLKIDHACSKPRHLQKYTMKCEMKLLVVYNCDADYFLMEIASNHIFLFEGNGIMVTNWLPACASGKENLPYADRQQCHSLWKLDSILSQNTVIYLISNCEWVKSVNGYTQQQDSLLNISRYSKYSQTSISYLFTFDGG